MTSDYVSRDRMVSVAIDDFFKSSPRLFETKLDLIHALGCVIRQRPHGEAYRDCIGSPPDVDAAALIFPNIIDVASSNHLKYAVHEAVHHFCGDDALDDEALLMAFEVSIYATLKREEDRLEIFKFFAESTAKDFDGKCGDIAYLMCRQGGDISFSKIWRGLRYDAPGETWLTEKGCLRKSVIKKMMENKSIIDRSVEANIMNDNNNSNEQNNINADMAHDVKTTTNNSADQPLITHTLKVLAAEDMTEVSTAKNNPINDKLMAWMRDLSENRSLYFENKGFSAAVFLWDGAILNRSNNKEDDLIGELALQMNASRRLLVNNNLAKPDDSYHVKCNEMHIRMETIGRCSVVVFYSAGLAVVKSLKRYQVRALKKIIDISEKGI